MHLQVEVSSRDFRILSKCGWNKLCSTHLGQCWIRVLNPFSAMLDSDVEPIWLSFGLGCSIHLALCWIRVLNPFNPAFGCWTHLAQWWIRLLNQFEQCWSLVLNPNGEMLHSGSEAFSLDQYANAFKDGNHFHMNNFLCSHFICNLYQYIQQIA
jgi:hypothetical protein